MSSKTRKRLLVAAATVGLLGIALPASAQTDANEFSYSPEAQERGKPIAITGRCENDGELVVSVQQGEAGDGSYAFNKSFPASGGVKVTGSIVVPDDAPFGPYVISGGCRLGPTIVFSKNGPFAVVEKAGATTTTAAVPRATTTSPSTTTSTTIEGETTTTVYAVIPPLDTPVESDTPDTTATTVDEFAGTRNEDNDSIGPLLLLVGLVPLGLAVAAIASRYAATAPRWRPTRRRSTSRRPR